ARASGRRIVEMVWDDLTPRTVLTPGAFRNAVAAVLAVSGSINCVKHLQAIAVEAGLDLDVFALFNEMGAHVPVLSAVAPNGPDPIDAFEAAGGTPALLNVLRPVLDLDARTVTGHSRGEALATAPPPDGRVIRRFEQPYSSAASIVVLRGSLATESAIARP